MLQISCRTFSNITIHRLGGRNPPSAWDPTGRHSTPTSCCRNRCRCRPMTKRSTGHMIFCKPHFANHTVQKLSACRKSVMPLEHTTKVLTGSQHPGATRNKMWTNSKPPIPTRCHKPLPCRGHCWVGLQIGPLQEKKPKMPYASYRSLCSYQKSKGISIFLRLKKAAN